MQVRGAAPFCLRAELGAQWLVALRGGEQTIQQRAQIQAGAATYDRQAAALRDAGDGFAGQAAVVARGAGLVRIGDVDEVVRHALALVQRGLGGADLHAAIDGDGVATDDLAGELLCQRQRECGLAAGRRTGDDDQRREIYQRRHQPTVKTRCTPARRIAKTMAATASNSRPRT